MKLQYFLKMKPPPVLLLPFSAPEGCFERICWLHGSHSSDKRGNWFLHYSIPLGYNRSPVDKDGLDLTLVNIQMFVHPKWGTRGREIDRSHLGTSSVALLHPEWISLLVKRRFLRGVRVSHGTTWTQNPNMIVNGNPWGRTLIVYWLPELE